MCWLQFCLCAAMDSSLLGNLKWKSLITQSAGLPTTCEGFNITEKEPFVCNRAQENGETFQQDGERFGLKSLPAWVGFPAWLNDRMISQLQRAGVFQGIVWGKLSTGQLLKRSLQLYDSMYSVKRYLGTRCKYYGADKSWEHTSKNKHKIIIKLLWRIWAELPFSWPGWGRNCSEKPTCPCTSQDCAYNNPHIIPYLYSDLESTGCTSLHRVFPNF